jgi:hypothetical protein
VVERQAYTNEAWYHYTKWEVKLGEFKEFGLAHTARKYQSCTSMPLIGLPEDGSDTSLAKKVTKNSWLHLFFFSFFLGVMILGFELGTFSLLASTLPLETHPQTFLLYFFT